MAAHHHSATCLNQRGACLACNLSHFDSPEVYLTASLVANGKNLPLPITSNFHLFDPKKESALVAFMLFNARSWNEWLTFNVKYKDLPLTTQLVFTVWYSAAPGERRPLGGTCMSLYNHKRYPPAFMLLLTRVANFGKAVSA